MGFSHIRLRADNADVGEIGLDGEVDDAFHACVSDSTPCIAHGEDLVACEEVPLCYGLASSISITQSCIEICERSFLSTTGTTRTWKIGENKAAAENIRIRVYSARIRLIFQPADDIVVNLLDDAIERPQSRLPRRRRFRRKPQERLRTFRSRPKDHPFSRRVRKEL